MTLLFAKMCALPLIRLELVSPTIWTIELLFSVVTYNEKMREVLIRGINVFHDLY